MTLPLDRRAIAAAFLAAIGLVSTAYAQVIPVPTKRPSEIGNNQIRHNQSSDCLKRLSELGADFLPVQSITSDTACGIDKPVKLTNLAGGIALEPAATINCPTAVAFAEYSILVLVPAGRRYKPLKDITSISIGSSYVCRTRNNQKGFRLSEHAKGNAIDVSAIAFSDGEIFSISPKDGSGTREEAFQKAIRYGACQFFTTVLGPGSDMFHDDHLHLDLAKRRGGYRLCRFPSDAPQ